MIRAGGAEPVEFGPVGIRLLLGALGTGAQVGAQFLAFAGGIGAGLAQGVLGTGADPAGFCLGGFGGGLRAGALLLGLPGCGRSSRCECDAER